MPIAVYEHAILALNSSVFMLIGGHDGNESLAKTFYYYEDKDEWIAGPELSQSRSRHAVGFGMDTSTSECYIAVTGGKPSDYGFLQTVELLYVGETEWQAGKYQQFH